MYMSVSVDLLLNFWFCCQRSSLCLRDQTWQCIERGKLDSCKFYHWHSIQVDIAMKTRLPESNDSGEQGNGGGRGRGDRVGTLVRSLTNHCFPVFSLPSPDPSQLKWMNWDNKQHHEKWVYPIDDGNLPSINFSKLCHPNSWLLRTASWQDQWLWCCGGKWQSLARWLKRTKCVPWQIKT